MEKVRDCIFDVIPLEVGMEIFRHLSLTDIPHVIPTFDRFADALIALRYTSLKNTRYREIRRCLTYLKVKNGPKYKWMWAIGKYSLDKLMFNFFKEHETTKNQKCIQSQFWNPCFDFLESRDAKMYWSMSEGIAMHQNIFLYKSMTEYIETRSEECCGDDIEDMWIIHAIRYNWIELVNIFLEQDNAVKKINRALCKVFENNIYSIGLCDRISDVLVSKFSALAHDTSWDEGKYIIKFLLTFDSTFEIVLSLKNMVPAHEWQYYHIQIVWAIKNKHYRAADALMNMDHYHHLSANKDFHKWVFT